MQNSHRSTSSMLQHISSNITKLLEVLEEATPDPGGGGEGGNWVATPTIPRAIVKAEPSIPQESFLNNSDQIKRTYYVNILSLLLSSVTTIVTLLAGILPKLVEARYRSIEAPQAEPAQQQQGTKRKREKSDALADDGTHIIIVTRKMLPKQIGNEYFVVDITDKSKKFSTRFAHMNIPVPFMKADRVGSTVEGIWQGLRVFKNEGVKGECMIATNPKTRKWDESRGAFLGWRTGLQGTEILSAGEATKRILIPMYKHVLENHLREETNQIKRELEGGKKVVIVCEKGEMAWEVEDTDLRFGAAGMLKLYLTNKL